MDGGEAADRQRPVFVPGDAVIRRLFCALGGHHAVIVFLRDRMFLHCAVCGYESPGWKVDR